MPNKVLVERLASSVGEINSSVGILGLQQLTTDDMQLRTQRFLSLIGETEQRSLERFDWQQRDDHSLLHLNAGARAVLYHQSGAMKYASGLAPFDALFEKMPDKETLIRSVEETAKRLAISEWAGKQGEIRFERLWQTKAQGTDRNGRSSDPVLCRVVGAYRHFIEGIPVLGAASVALELAGSGAIDSMQVQVRPSAQTTVDKTRVLNPELAAIQINAQLASQLGVGTDGISTELIQSMSMQYGYLNLGKRKAQRVLAPAYVAQVVLQHKDERQAYMFAVSATEKSYLPICQCAHEALPTNGRVPAATATLNRTMAKRGR